MPAKRMPGVEQLNQESALKTVVRLLRQTTQPVCITAGSAFVEKAGRRGALVFLVAGTLRVEQRADGQESAFAYRLHAVDRPLLLTGCLCPIDVIAETDVEAFFVPVGDFNALVTLSPNLRAFVFRMCSDQISDLTDVIADPLALKSARDYLETHLPTPQAWH